MKKLLAALFFSAQAVILTANVVLPPVLAAHINSVSPVDPPQLLALLACGAGLALDSAVVGWFISRINPTGRVGLPLWLLCVALSTYGALWFGCGDVIFPLFHWSSATVWVATSVAIFVPAGIVFLIPQAVRCIPQMLQYVYSKR